MDGSNGYGLHDVAGNAFEWCNDWYDSEYYGSSPPDNPHGPAGPLTHRVIRGGSWFGNEDFLRCASRGYSAPAGRQFHVGFRLVWKAE